MLSFPDNDLEFQRCWSAEAAKVAVCKHTLNLIDERCGKAYISRRDDVASELRDIARVVRDWIKIHEENVSKYIEEDKRRKYELMKPLRH